MFEGCENLKNIQLSRGLEYIKKECFYGSGLEEITLPRSLKKIDKFTFSGCENLQTIYVEDGCDISFFNVRVPISAEIISLHTQVQSDNIYRNLKQ